MITFATTPPPLGGLRKTVAPFPLPFLALTPPPPPGALPFYGYVSLNFTPSCSREQWLL
jgi:hypothetical protein